MSFDLADHLLRKSLGAAAADTSRCARCRRTPLPGEVLHVFEHERTLCALCAAALPEGERRPVRRERVHAAPRHLAVAPRAA